MSQENSLVQRIERMRQRNEQDADAFANLPHDLCQLCHAQGPDKRSLFIDCLYNLQEVLPEALCLIGLSEIEYPELRKRGYYLRICKSCRARLLRMLALWRQNCLNQRDLPKDQDGALISEETAGLIPVREHGAIRYLSETEYAEWKEQHR